MTTLAIILSVASAIYTYYTTTQNNLDNQYLFDEMNVIWDELERIDTIREKEGDK